MTARPPLVVAAVLLQAAACGPQKPYAGAPPAPLPGDLPARVFLKTPTESFTHEWYVVLRAGRLWIKPNAETRPDAAAEAWRLLPPDGFAHHERRDLGGAPPALREISADGDNLAAVGDDGLVYYMKFHDLGWIDHWGLPPFGGALYAPPPYRSLAMSHRGPLALYYEDIDGNAHPVTAGVTTFYRLSADGRELGYADPWLPAGFGRRICLPARGRLALVALAASASTLFVVDGAGRMWTRLADYDSMGDNPVLAYTWKRGRRAWDQDRSLPGESWEMQPPVPGKVTARLTIFQTGKGNAARTLRIEGADGEGHGGFWQKAIQAPTWTFVPTGAPPAGPFLDGEPSVGAARGRDLRGAILRAPRAATLASGLTVELVDFDPDCSPATIRIHDGRSAPIEIPLHLYRATRDQQGNVTRALGALGPLRDAKGLVMASGGDTVIDVAVAIGPRAVRVVGPALDLRFTK